MAEIEHGHVAPEPLAPDWDDIYRGKTSEQFSWYEAAPTRSLEAIAALAPWVDASIVDVGGGESRLVDLLLERGHRRVTVVDISTAALERAETRLGEAAALVSWIRADVGAPLDEATEPLWPRAPFAVWHDRAAFHFLTMEEQQEAYVARVVRSVAHGGHVVIAGFDSTGPDRCSGLPVVRRSLHELSQVLPPEFELQEASRFAHVTPWGTPQAFAQCIWQRVG